MDFSSPAHRHQMIGAWKLNELQYSKRLSLYPSWSFQHIERVISTVAQSDCYIIRVRVHLACLFPILIHDFYYFSPLAIVSEDVPRSRCAHYATSITRFDVLMRLTES